VHNKWVQELYATIIVGYNTAILLRIDFEFRP